MGRPILCLTTTHPSHNDAAASSTSSTLGSGGGSMTLACPLTCSLLSSLRVTGDLAGKIPIGIHSLSFFPQDFCTMTTSNNSASTPQQLAVAYGWSSSSNANNNKEDAYAMLLTIRRQTASATNAAVGTTNEACSLPPIVHWKCRIPEANLTAGLLVSTCGLYIIGGGASGNLYVWKSIGGELIRTICKAHYRSITSLTWQTTRGGGSRDNTNTTTSLYLVTGGADGMVHVFSLVDLVSKTTPSSSSASIYPLVTWSRHHMPVTAVCSLSDRRLVTTSLDGQVLLLDLSSSSSSGTINGSASSNNNTGSTGSTGGTVLAALQLPHGIQSLIMDPNTQTLYAGSVQGTIYIIAWDEYAIYQIQQHYGVNVILSNGQDGSSSSSSNKRQKHFQQSSSMTNQVFGDYRKKEQQLQDSKSYQTELSGHNRSVTSLALVNAAASGTSGCNETVLLCSGDEGGTLRIWDTTSRGCIHIVNPWSTNTTNAAAAAAAASAKPGSSKTAATAKKRHHHPITSIRVIMEETLESVMDHHAVNVGFCMSAVTATANNSTMRGDKHTTSMVNLVTPLQKFVTTSQDHQRADATLLLRPSLALTKSMNSTLFWDVARDSSRQRLVRQRQLREQQQQQNAQPQQPQQQPKANDEDYRAKAEALQKELNKAQATIQRWEAVNNKLMAQLQK